MNCIFAALALTFGMLSVPSLASVVVESGTVSINVSGSDGYYSGEDGDRAGQVDLVLSYTDASKKTVHLGGQAVRGGRTERIDKNVALAELKSIEIYAIGGDGARGSDGYSGNSGRDGYDGRDGQNGSDGCPPSSGSNGEDGQDGSDGTDGGIGGSGGDGGSGGSVQVSTAPDQSELMLFVKTYTRGGYGGDGGSGGWGGSGGRAGRGGRGGSGGRNTCVDDKGNPTGGPDGSSGWSGRDGRDGSPGRSGSSGYSGSGGRSGSRSFLLVSASGTQTYTSPFDLDITLATLTDDLTDVVAQPGERVHLTGLQVSNKSLMPSPVGQTIQLSLLKSKTMVPLSKSSAGLAPLGGNASSQLNFKKGELVFQVPDQKDLLGQKAVANLRLSINGVTLDYDVDSGMAIGWPANFSAGATRLTGNFEVAKTLDYSIKNVGSVPLGPNGPQPFKIQFNWSSKNIPARDVVVKLADGRSFNLSQPAEITDLSVPAKSTVGFSVQLLVRNRALLASGAGALTTSLRMRDFGRGEDVVQAQDTAVTMSLDTKAIDWHQTVSFARNHIQCIFPKFAERAQQMAYVQVAKPAGSDQMEIQVALTRSVSPVSPVIKVSSSKMLPYYEKFSDVWDTQTAIDFLNKIVSPAAPEGVWAFRGCTTAP